MTDTAEPAISGSPMLELLAGFIQELREAGLPVSLTENLDAMEAVKHIPLEDREAFKYALAATLVKNNPTGGRSRRSSRCTSRCGAASTRSATSSTSCWPATEDELTEQPPEGMDGMQRLGRRRRRADARGAGRDALPGAARTATTP